MKNLSKKKDNYCKTTEIFYEDDDIKQTLVGIFNSVKQEIKNSLDGNKDIILSLIREIITSCNDVSSSLNNCTNYKWILHAIREDEQNFDIMSINTVENISALTLNQQLRLKRILIWYKLNKDLMLILISDIQYTLDYYEAIIGGDENEFNSYKDSAIVEVANLNIKFNSVIQDIYNSVIENFLNIYYTNEANKTSAKNILANYLHSYNNNRSLSNDVTYNTLVSFLFKSRAYTVSFEDTLSLYDYELHPEQSIIVNHPNKNIFCLNSDYLNYFTFIHEIAHNISQIDIDNELIIKINDRLVKIIKNSDISRFNSAIDSLGNKSIFTQNFPNFLSELKNTNENKIIDLLADHFSCVILIRKLLNDVNIGKSNKCNSKKLHFIIKNFIKVMNELTGDNNHYETNIRLLLNILLNDEIKDVFIKFYNKLYPAKLTPPAMLGGYYEKYLKYKNKYLLLKNNKIEKNN